MSGAADAEEGVHIGARAQGEEMVQPDRSDQATDDRRDFVDSNDKRRPNANDFVDFQSKQDGLGYHVRPC